MRDPDLLDSAQRRWRTRIAPVEHVIDLDHAPGSRWSDLWTVAFAAHVDIAHWRPTGQLGPQDQADLESARRSAQEDLARLLDAAQQRHTPTPRLVRRSDPLPGPLRRRLLGVPESEQDLPLDQLPDTRPPRWLVVNEQDLRNQAMVGHTTAACWVALTDNAAVTHPGPHGDLRVYAIPAIVADLVAADPTSSAAQVTPARRADTVATVDTALRLWREHLYEDSPLRSWATCLTASRGIHA